MAARTDRTNAEYLAALDREADALTRALDALVEAREACQASIRRDEIRSICRRVLSMHALAVAAHRLGSEVLP